MNERKPKTFGPNYHLKVKYSDRDVTYSNQCSSQKPSYRLRNIIDGSVRFKTMEQANCVRELNMHEHHRSGPTNEYGSFLNDISQISKYLRWGFEDCSCCHDNALGFCLGVCLNAAVAAWFLLSFFVRALSLLLSADLIWWVICVNFI